MLQVIILCLSMAISHLVSGKPLSTTPCFDPRAPCKCDVHMVHLDKAGLVPVTEYVCNPNKTNKNKLPEGFECTQLHSNVWVNTLDIVIDVKSGCELRCTNDSCSQNVRITSNIRWRNINIRFENLKRFLVFTKYSFLWSE